MHINKPDCRQTITKKERIYMISLVEISKNTEVKKAICPQCKKTIHSIGFKKGSTCNGITVVCKFCGRVYEVKAD